MANLALALALGGCGDAAAERANHIHDLPDAILSTIFALVSDVRSRNSMALVCHKWRHLERSTRTSLSLRGNVRHLFLLPTCFPSVSHLDLSLLSPWGYPFLHNPNLHHQNLDDYSGDGNGDDHQYYLTTNQELIARRLAQAFPDLESLVVYARNPSTLRALAPRWPALRHAALVRWHNRPSQPPGADLHPLFANCPSLSSLDLSRFYCWPDDIPAALHAFPSSATSLTILNLLNPAIPDGFGASELVQISEFCPNLRDLRACCIFNPMCMNSVGDEALLALAVKCPQLAVLHLADAQAGQRTTDVQAAGQDSRITSLVLGEVFAALPRLEDLVLDLCHCVRDVGLALEILGNRCPKMRRVKLGQFYGVCRAAGLHLDGVAVCGGLRSLCIKNSPDLTDSSLVTIARGSQMLAELEVHGCEIVSEEGIRRMAGMLRSTLVNVTISSCPRLDTAASLRALAPVCDRIEQLQIDCVWAADDDAEAENGRMPTKRRRCSNEDSGHQSNGGVHYDSWDRLRYLSVWLPAGEVLSPLPDAGLQNCPALEEICIKVEGDCRTCPRPAGRIFGLDCLTRYPRLSKMKLDCAEAIGYALTAPMGHMDLSLWERFYVDGIQTLDGLIELDYWPPQDREMNHRSLFLPAAGLISKCQRLRRLFIHGTTHEHFMNGFFGRMPELRDCQLRGDYYPAPEDDMCTEMRVDSCSRFEEELNNRVISERR